MHVELVRDKAKRLPALDRPLAVTSARIWHCKYASLVPLTTLCNLAVLVIATYPDDTFAPLGQLKLLRHLRVLHFPLAKDLAPLAALTNLETLSLSSLPSWDASGKVLTVQSFAPIASLPKLRHIELFGVKPAVGGLAPLLEVKGLRSARFSKLSKVEIKAFYAASGASDDFAPEPVFAAA